MNLETLVAKLQDGFANGPPAARETVSDCLLGLLFAALDVYIRQPSTPLSLEVSALFVVLKSGEDSLLADLGMLERTALSSTIVMLERLRSANVPEAPKT